MKNKLRKEYMKIRDYMSLSEIEQKSKIIEEKILNLNCLKEYKNILVYINIGSEVITENIINILLKKGKNVYIPKIINNEMIFLKINSIKDLKIGRYNIPEPQNGKIYNGEKALVIVPGLIFSKDKFRIGYGKRIL